MCMYRTVQGGTKVLHVDGWGESALTHGGKYPRFHKDAHEFMSNQVLDEDPAGGVYINIAHVGLEP